METVVSFTAVFFLVLGILNVTSGAPVMSFHTCTNSSIIISVVKDCYDDVGIPFPQLPSDFVNKDEQAKLKFISESFQNPNKTETCRRLPVYKQVTTCVMKPLRECMDVLGSLIGLPNMRSFYPTDAQLSEVQDLICENPDDYNSKCVDNASSGILSCTKKRTRIARHQSRLSKHDMLCRSIQVGYQCGRELITSCGQTTSSIYNKSTFMLMPATCGAEEVRVALLVHCCAYILSSLFFHFF